MSDWKDTKESQEGDKPKESTDGKVTPTGQASMKGHVDARDVPQDTYPDQRFADAQGRPLTMRTFPSGDKFYVRIYDDEKTPEPPERPSFGDAGKADLHLERDTEGDAARAKLQDIYTPPTYRRAGVASRMLAQCENIARQNGASEIHGVAPSKPEDRQWYEKRGYAFRKEGSEVYKVLSDRSAAH